MEDEQTNLSFLQTNLHDSITECDFSTYGGYNAAHVYDLYKDTVTFQLMCSLNGESGDDYDMPIEAVCLEGLFEIVKWLKKFGFLRSFSN